MGNAIGPYDFTKARKTIVATVGKETIVALHKQSVVRDIAGIVGLYGAFAFNIWFLGNHARGGSLWPIWWLLFVLQGFIIMAFGYLLHDACVHRKFGGKRFSYWLGVVSGVLSFQPYSQYRHTHLDHHSYTGTDEDEAYKQDLDTRARRLLFLTPIGYFATFYRFLRRNFPPKWPSPDGSFGKVPDKALLLRETVIVLGSYALMVVAWRYWKRPVQYGFLMPALFILPIANTFRTILEHAETNPANNYHCATFYRTGLISRVLFFWDAGDCHMVHHIFPSIPWYRMGKACDTFRPVFLDAGVRERRSIWQLAHGYFVKNREHRTLWPV